MIQRETIPEQECIPVGCVPPACWPYPSMHCRGVYLPRVVYVPWGCTCPGGLPAQGGGVPAQGGYLPRGGGVPAWGCTCQGVYLPRGWCTCLGGVSARGCTCPGVYLPGGGYLPRGYLPRYSPPVDRMTDRCKNITLPQTSFAGGNYLFWESSVSNRTHTLRIHCGGMERRGGGIWFWSNTCALYNCANN